MNKIITLVIGGCLFISLFVLYGFTGAPCTSVAVANAKAQPGQTIPVAITVNNRSKDVIGIDMWIQYDPVILEAKDVLKGAFIGSGNITVNTREKGILKIAIFTTKPFAYGKDNLVMLNFKVKDNVPSPKSTTLHISKVRFNNKSVCLAVDGQLTITRDSKKK